MVEINILKAPLLDEGSIRKKKYWAENYTETEKMVSSGCHKSMEKMDR